MAVYHLKPSLTCKVLAHEVVPPTNGLDLSTSNQIKRKFHNHDSRPGLDNFSIESLFKVNSMLCQVDI